MPDLSEQIQLLRDDAGLVVLDREVIIAEGEAAVDYLQGQLSQEIESLEPGHARWSFVLQPQGKVDAWFRVGRLDDTTFVLDIDSGWGDALLERLERFRLRTPVDFSRSEWRVTALRGAAIPPPAHPSTPGHGLVVPVEWPGDVGWDVIGPGVTDGPTECSTDAMEVLRIEAGRPRMGNELDHDTIPAASGVVAQSVSFTKGCFTGQELVARIDSRGGQSPQSLVGVRIDGDLSPDVGAELWHEGAKVGRVTSVAPVSSSGGPVALAYLKRSVDIPCPVSVGEGADPLIGTAVPLPLASVGSA